MNSDILSAGCPLTETGLLPAHSAATLDMAALPAHTLIMEKHHTLSPTFSPALHLVCFIWVFR